MNETAGLRQGEYADRGDYHRAPDHTWDYLPTYLAKMAWVRAHLDRLPRGTRVLDIGCGEGVLVAEYRDRLAIEGIDSNYSSEYVRHGAATELPAESGTVDCVLCLDVLEHLSYDDQPVALAEMRRVLKTGGEALLSLPNLAHLQSRVHFLVGGELIRTASERKHPGDRPVNEYLRLLQSAGFSCVERRGVFPTVPVLAHFIRRHPVRLAWLHAALTRLLPVSGWCFLNLVRATAAPTANAADRG